MTDGTKKEKRLTKTAAERGGGGRDDEWRELTERAARPKPQQPSATRREETDSLERLGEHQRVRQQRAVRHRHDPAPRGGGATTTTRGKRSKMRRWR